MKVKVSYTANVTDKAREALAATLGLPLCKITREQVRRFLVDYGRLRFDELEAEGAEA